MNNSRNWKKGDLSKRSQDFSKRHLQEDIYEMGTDYGAREQWQGEKSSRQKERQSKIPDGIDK